MDHGNNQSSSDNQNAASSQPQADGGSMPEMPQQPQQPPQQQHYAPPAWHSMSGSVEGNQQGYNQGQQPQVNVSVGPTNPAAQTGQQAMQPMHGERKPIGPSEKTAEKIEDGFMFFYFIIAGLLGFRFVLSLLGASTASEFVVMVYDLSDPFMAPFALMFGRSLGVGNFRFEFEVIVALVAYAAVFFGLARLARIFLR